VHAVTCQSVMSDSEPFLCVPSYTSCSKATELYTRSDLPFCLLSLSLNRPCRIISEAASLSVQGVLWKVSLVFGYPPFSICLQEAGRRSRQSQRNDSICRIV
jgi:hypothetical protein